MILYFSGTGNSQYVANLIADMRKDSIKSINHSMRIKEQAVICSKYPLVFVLPTYSWRIPRVVENWIKEAQIEEGQAVYFILTCGGDCGNAWHYAKKLCEDKGLCFRGLISIVMPENYLALFPTPDQTACTAMVKQVEQEIAELIKPIQSGHSFQEPKISFADRCKSGPINSLFYTFFVHDKKFQVSQNCISCGKCAVHCPLNNIELKQGKPVWKGNCTHCMACIAGCPLQAIEYGRKSKGKHRHYIWKDIEDVEEGDM